MGLEHCHGETLELLKVDLGRVYMVDFSELHRQLDYIYWIDISFDTTFCSLLKKQNVLPMLVIRIGQEIDPLL